MDDPPTGGEKGIGRTGSIRKRPLEATAHVSRMPSDTVSTSSEHSADMNTVLDEIELHFQRSLSEPRTKRITLSESVALNGVISQPESQQVQKASPEGKTPLSITSSTESSYFTVKGDMLAATTKNTHNNMQVTKEQSISDSYPSAGFVKLDRISSELSIPTGSECATSKSNSSTVSDCTAFPTSTKSLAVTLGSSNKATHGSTNKLQDCSVSIISSKSSSMLESFQTDISRKIESCDFSSSVNSSLSSFTSSKVHTSQVHNPVILLPSAANVPTTTLLVQPQPCVLVNQTDVQRMNSAPFLSSSSVYGGSGGFILLSPGHAQTNSLFQVVSSPAINSGITSSTVPITPPFMVFSTPKAIPVNSNRSVSTCSLPSSKLHSKKDEINVMPASVEDHFAKALGDQWSELKSGRLSPSPSTVKS